MDQPSIISVQGLCNSFGEQVIHQDLNLEVRRGEILGVVGGSGTGKSVLLKCILGLLDPEAGSIKIDGQEVIGMPARERLGRTLA